MDRFKSSIKPPNEISQESIWFIFLNDGILLLPGIEKSSLPNKYQLEAIHEIIDEFYFLGEHEEKEYYVARLIEEPETDFFEFIRLRKSYYVLEEREFFLAARAFQTLYFHTRNRYCGKCGGKTIIEKNEFARTCTVCSEVFYPQQAPAVIAAVVKDDKILLGRSKRFPVEMYSVLAGFVEPGESLEDCVKREVREEAGIEVKNIQYFGSQTWPFPNSLMIGFTAEWESGEIKIDEEEIVDADWFFHDKLPVIPDTVSIARKLIDNFVETRK
ncbi:MAG: NAD(+) diphosphatase [Bacteroidetes bacterium]|nr:NAD(+) diphosphatase [Bacteroidota bacterium]